ncbi:MAG: NADH-quinone oxidoreductase subunit F [Acidimicrobiia bacterium]|nr:NADH-quinone oxidoreductase subunit F [Acidimicrobiia bacterium]
MPGFLLPNSPITSLADYRSRGGGRGLERALEIGPAAVVAEMRLSGLRGRGGGGFPTGVKWAGLAEDSATERYVVANGAEGEPGTFKDRWLMRSNPYQLIEGLLIAAFATGAVGAYIALKRSFIDEAEAVKRAISEMSSDGLLGELPVGMVEGPDDYLFGEEKALLEVIEGNDPLPRLYPPYVQGLFETPNESHPAAVNNVETLSNVPHIIREGAEWFRSFGTNESPGTMVFTISGDVQREAVVELEMGTSLSFLIYGVGEGLSAGRRVKAVISGVSNAPLPSRFLDLPMSFEAMKAAGSGLGAGGFIVYDDTACMVRVGAVLSRFLNRESCGQCPPCKLGTGEIAARLEELGSGATGRDADLEELEGWILRVTDANRCGLGAGQQALANGIVAEFGEDVAHHLDPSADFDQTACDDQRSHELPALSAYDPVAGAFARS